MCRSAVVGFVSVGLSGGQGDLVQAVSRPNHCHAVWAERLGLVTVVGRETDLDLVELLTTSPLVQCL